MSLVLFLAAGAVASSRAVRLPVVEPRATTVAVAVAEVVQERDALATCVYTCGSVCYWQEDIDEALEQGYADYKSGSDPGTSPSFCLSLFLPTSLIFFVVVVAVLRRRGRGRATYVIIVNGPKY